MNVHLDYVFGKQDRDRVINRRRHNKYNRAFLSIFFFPLSILKTEQISSSERKGCICINYYYNNVIITKLVLLEYLIFNVDGRPPENFLDSALI